MLFWLSIFKVHQKELQTYSVKQAGLPEVKQEDVESLALLEKCRLAVDAACAGAETAEEHQDQMSEMTNFNT